MHCFIIQFCSNAVFLNMRDSYLYICYFYQVDFSWETIPMACIKCFHNVLLSTLPKYQWYLWLPFQHSLHFFFITVRNEYGFEGRGNSSFKHTVMGPYLCTVGVTCLRLITSFQVMWGEKKAINLEESKIEIMPKGSKNYIFVGFKSWQFPERNSIHMLLE